MLWILAQFDSGESLLEAFEPEQFDICFLDIYMKEMNGMTVARELRAWILIFLLSF